ncbi:MULTISPECIES: glycoside hydrolase family 1 protein [Actinokineospora]|uniref:Beta-glucosidase n=1 Tax=Actinokineospora fastidiosa TaxID=1816 RepID=A0A918LI49_9PSEU|nr:MULTISPECIES: family 1 glycosylhydrolase [Actinokineospora]UVS80524.1 Beta-glucosidase A [Actinokineospora sp. UTMC 2448]GGS54590.1 beta-glucosidase [Actinokineospora fastidiosa]
MTSTFPGGFLWGAATAAHQVEGNNTTSDLWAVENAPESIMPERSGDACDSYHRWPEDLDIVRDIGLNCYRFGIEWARVEPAPGHTSRAQLAHYRRMVEGCFERGLTPVVTLHHFTTPAWFRAAGGWTTGEGVSRFRDYVRSVLPILDGVEWVCTINEPNMLAMMSAMLKRGERHENVAGAMPPPDQDVADALIAAHRAAREELATLPRVRSGWTVANQNFQAAAGAEDLTAEWSRSREDQFLDVAKDDDFIGVQAYTRVVIGPDGPRDPGGARRTLTGWEFYPEALEGAVRHTARRVGPTVPILVTENGIATADDAERVDYTRRALTGLARAIDDGVDVRGYLHWSLLDNYEWGSWTPTFGLVSVDRETFTRTIKPSARWYGGVARAGSL